MESIKKQLRLHKNFSTQSLTDNEASSSPVAADPPTDGDVAFQRLGGFHPACLRIRSLKGADVRERRSRVSLVTPVEEECDAHLFI